MRVPCNNNNPSWPEDMAVDTGIRGQPISQNRRTGNRERTTHQSTSLHALPVPTSSTQSPSASSRNSSTLARMGSLAAATWGEAVREQREGVKGGWRQETRPLGDFMSCTDEES